MPNPIIGRRLTVLTKNGDRHDFTHIIEFRIGTEAILIKGETDDVDGMRINVSNFYLHENLHLIIFEPYKAK